MADTTITLSKTGDTGASTTKRVAIVHANDHLFTPERLENCTVLLSNTTAAEKVFTIAAGVGSAKGVGDLTATLAAGNATEQIAVFSGLDSARFLQANGTVKITVAASTTGFIQVTQL